MARSIKFSDDTFLDASGVVKGQKTLDSMLGTSLGSFNKPTLEDFLKDVIAMLFTDNYPFFIGNATLIGYDQFSIFYVSRVAIITNSSSFYLVRYIDETTINISQLIPQVV